jgi:hypothetical protein
VLNNNYSFIIEKTTMNSKSNTTLTCSLNNTGIDVLIWQIGAFLFPVIGLPGHLLMIITILNSDRRRFHPTSLYFIFMALAESIYLSFMFWDWLDVVNLAPDPRKILNCAYFYPFVGSAAFISLVLLVQLNIDRIHMINKPYKTHSKITNKRILIKVCLTYSTSILFLIHYRYSLHYNQTAFTIYGQSCRVYDHAHLWFYSIWPYIHLLCRLIPCLIFILCTLYVCWNRCHHNHYYIRSLSNSVHRQQQTFSIILVFVSIYTFIAVVPIAILQLFNHEMNQYEIEYNRHQCRYNTDKANKWKLLNALFIMWEASTYMNKFYIRLIFSSEFRHDVKKVIFCRFRNKDRQGNFI